MTTANDDTPKPRSLDAGGLDAEALDAAALAADALEIEALESELREARAELEAVVEAVLFVAHDPVPRNKLLGVLGGGDAANEAIDAVLARHTEGPARGVFVEEVAGGLRMVTRPALHGWLRRFFEITGKNRLSMPALETLAIVAYRQPVTAPEIQELRGVSSSGVLKKLLEKRLVRIAGRKEVVGKPFLYGTTREFLMHFGLRSLKELPPLEQFEELFAVEGEADAPVDSEAASDDAEEVVLREAAQLAEAEDEAADEAEQREIDEEREAAEAEEQMADDPPEALDDEPVGDSVRPEIVDSADTAEDVPEGTEDGNLQEAVPDEAARDDAPDAARSGTERP